MEESPFNPTKMGQQEPLGDDGITWLRQQHLLKPLVKGLRMENESELKLTLLSVLQAWSKNDWKEYLDPNYFAAHAYLLFHPDAGQTTGGPADSPSAHFTLEALLEGLRMSPEKRYEQEWIRTDENPFMVRKCYIELFELIKVDMSKKTTILITGTPGIGKSNFGLYIMCRLLKEDNCSFLYEQDSTAVVLCTKTGDTIKYVSLSRDKARAAGWYDRDDCVYIADILEHKEPTPAPNMCTIICSSPNQARFKEAMKMKGPQPGHQYRKFYMPLWTDEEMAAFLKMLSEREHNKEDFLAEKQERMRKAGNVPRQLFYEDIDRALEKYGSIAEELIDHFEKREVKDESVTYKLVHVQASENYLESRMTWASEYVLDKLVELSSNKLLKALEDLVKHSHMPDLQTLRGRIYERCIHQMFRKQLQCEAITLDEEMASMKIPHCEDHHTFHSKEVVTDKPDTYLQPIASNQESIDSLSYQIVTQVAPPTQAGSSQGKRKRKKVSVQSSRKMDKKMTVTEKAKVHLWLFQVTVSKKHPVKWKGINAILSQFDKAYQVAEIYLVFVFPKQLNDFPAQSYLDSSGLVRNLPKKVKITQCKCPLDISLNSSDLTPE